MPVLSGGMGKIYADYFKKHEQNQVKMLHRVDFYEPGPPHDSFSPKMLEIVEKYAGKEILDIGCGAGVNCRELKKRGFSCTGIEINPEYVESAQRHIDARLMRAEKLDFPDRSFDTVTMLEVLEHVDDPYAALAEIVRVARGNLIVSVPNVEPIIECVRHNVVMHHFMDPTHVNFFTEGMLERFLKDYFPHVRVIPYERFFEISGRRLYYHLAAVASFKELRP